MHNIFVVPKNEILENALQNVFILFCFSIRISRNRFASAKRLIGT